MDLGPILDDLAAGRIDADEANRRIEALKADSGTEASDAGPSQSDQSASTAPPVGLKRVSISAVRRRVRVEADSSVPTLSVEGEHVLRRNGDVMEVTASGEGGKGFKLPPLRPSKALAGIRDLGIGKEMTVRVNPRLVVDAEVTTGSLRTEGILLLGRVRVTGGPCTIEGATQVSDLLSQAGGVHLSGPISQGRSTVKVESGAVTVELTEGANVTVHASSRMGRVNWPGEDDKVDQLVVGNGSARLDVNVNLGLATITTEEQ